MEKSLLLTPSGWLQLLVPRCAAQGRAGDKAEPGRLGGEQERGDMWLELVGGRGEPGVCRGKGRMI